MQYVIYVIRRIYIHVYTWASSILYKYLFVRFILGHQHMVCCLYIHLTHNVYCVYMYVTTQNILCVHVRYNTKYIVCIFMLQYKVYLCGHQFYDIDQIIKNMRPRSQLKCFTFFYYYFSQKEYIFVY